MMASKNDVGEKEWREVKRKKKKKSTYSIARESEEKKTHTTTTTHNKECELNAELQDDKQPKKERPNDSKQIHYLSWVQGDIHVTQLETHELPEKRIGAHS